MLVKAWLPLPPLTQHIEWKDCKASVVAVQTVAAKEALMSQLQQQLDQQAASIAATNGDHEANMTKLITSLNQMQESCQAQVGPSKQQRQPTLQHSWLVCVPTPDEHADLEVTITSSLTTVIQACIAGCSMHMCSLCVRHCTRYDFKQHT